MKRLKSWALLGAIAALIFQSGVMPAHWSCSGFAFASDDANSKEANLKKRVAELIEKLGSDHYATRRQAQESLQQIGVLALDQLQAAILHSDPQIASTARYLVRSSFTNWTNDTDPLEVRKLLEHYSTNDETYREERIKLLAAVSFDRGLPSLLRIARYEVSGRLSRRAALSIFETTSKLPVRRTDAQTRQRWEAVVAAASQGKNQACQWLNEYASMKVNASEMNAEFWVSAVENESRLFQEKSMETSRELLVEFIRFTSEQLAENNRSLEALQVASRLSDIEYEDRNRLPHALDLCVWALDRGFPSIVIEQCEKPWIASIKHAYLDYLRAESYQRLGEAKQADEFANRAFLRGSAAESEFSMQDREAKAEFLNYRQQYVWAEREYRAALKIADPHDGATLGLTRSLAAMLVDGQDYAAAAEVMKPFADRFKREPAFAHEIDRDHKFSRVNSLLEEEKIGSYSERYTSNFLYYRGWDNMRSGKLEDAKQDLRKAWKLDSSNIDIAITMWKNRSDEAWNRESELAVEQAVKQFRQALPKLEREIQSNAPNEFASFQLDYAEALNMFAWTLVCTDRELDAALEHSQRACRLMPNSAAFLDTLARCLFEKGRVDEAIRTQKEAIALEPYSREIRRTLEEYESAPKKP
ncbi:MAG: hypothetical protein SGI77_18580 [Pirellulaceae bacterium]|nr:hypothetical protein [Pirellulaceae bacterium]